MRIKARVIYRSLLYGEREGMLFFDNHRYLVQFLMKPINQEFLVRILSIEER